MWGNTNHPGPGCRARISGKAQPQALTMLGHMGSGSRSKQLKGSVTVTTANCCNHWA